MTREPGQDAQRRGSFARQTKETRVEASVSLDGGERRIDVPNGFLGHMLDALACHGNLGLEVRATGDTHVDLHHTMEDIGIALGECLRSALGERAGVVRFAHAYAPLDEALARAVVDLSGRGFFAWRVPAELEQSWVTAEMPLTLLADFFQSLADHARLTLHLDVLAGRNPHHVAEACFKAVALALRAAVTLRAPGDAAGVPSTKGVLE
jgi:imidazoleglycerol-phosphate dehydratase